MVQGLSFGMIAMFAGGVIGQLIGVNLMPMTKGLTEPVPTIACAASFLIGLGLLTRLIHSGASLTTIVPLNAVAVPLGSLVIGIVFLGESASLARIVALVAACVLIGIANLF